MNGLGNDFVILDGLRQQISLTTEQLQLLGDRHFGVGCDQILLIEKSGIPGMDLRYRIFNADGREVEHCGNGIRCIGEYMFRQGYTANVEIHAETVRGTLVIYREADGMYRVNMGKPRLDPAEIPALFAERSTTYRVNLAAGEYSIMALSMGNPHAVMVVDDVDSTPVGSLGPAIQASGVFPEGVNVGFMQVLNRSSIRLRVFERGVGETLACGTGACAAMVAGNLADLLENNVDISVNGGRLKVAWDGGDSPVWMTGPATTVFEGIIEI